MLIVIMKRKMTVYWQNDQLTLIGLKNHLNNRIYYYTFIKSYNSGQIQAFS
jgi:hypothetical protein